MSAENLEAEENEVAEGTEEAAEEVRLNLDVKVDSPSACERHVTVTVPRDDIERYFNEEFTELVESAQVPGFRPGRAPRKLIEHRFRKEIAERVKGKILMDSLSQVTDEQELAAISEPDLDPDVIDVPEEGPLTFEFNVEVRPDFDMPNWKGLKLDRPVRDFSDEDVNRQMQNLLAQHGRLVPHDGPAASGDYIATRLAFKDGDKVISSSDEEVIRLRPVLSFRDGNIEGFDKILEGVKAGETRTAEAKLSQDAPNEALRGKTITAEFEVQEVKKLELPEMNEEFLSTLGNFESEADLKDAIKDTLQRQLKYAQQQRAREQITDLLQKSVDLDLPPALLQRQSQRELHRAVLELRSSGFSDAEIRAYENELRQNSAASTARALKEHFILERIAEDENVDADDMDYEREILMISLQSGDNPRRVRAQIEKQGLMDSLRNQIIERKVLDLIQEQAEFQEVPYEPEELEAEALDHSAGGGDEEESEIPAAKEAPGEPQPLPEHRDRS